ncbi:MAG TPA: histidinol dehydrogenase [Salinivirgaceae bacterium]|nr:histidinol dehydrogenase [Salinivirgaceae bacterium]
MKTIIDNLDLDYPELFKRPADNDLELKEKVRDILQMVKTKGDEALKALTKKYDGLDVDLLEINSHVIANSQQKVQASLKKSINQAAKNIEMFHSIQKLRNIEVETMPGVRCKLIYRPLKRVGLYVPGGTAPLISTVLMLGIPAKVAGCSELIVCTPPPIHPSILYACSLINAKVFTVGGAQAIAAMAFGTETIPKVDKIFGPGNRFVTEAKMQVAALGIPIDIPAGPSELLVIADNSAKPQFIAADLLSQAEHGTDSQVILISTDNNIITQTLTEIEQQIKTLPRKGIAMKTIENSYAIKVANIERAFEISNMYAPEHLILAVSNPEELERKIENAGSVFIGNYTPESAGDYASGTNHTLPTSGFAKNWSGVSLLSFTKTITFQTLTPDGLTNLGTTIVELAEAEQLTAHANAVKIRLSNLKNDDYDDN